MTEPRLVLFDLDGTLADSHGFLTQVVEESFRHAGSVLPPPELMREFYSLPFEEFFRRCDAFMSPEQIVKASEYMKATLRSRRDSGSMTEPFYPGIIEMLEQLKADGYVLGIVTNKGGHGLRLVLAANKATDYFFTLHHSDNSVPKPSPDMVFNALEGLGVEGSHTLVIGDSVIDMLTARNAGVRAIGVTWAGRDAAALTEAGALSIVSEVSQLVPAIKALL